MPHALRSMHAREEGIGSRVYQASGRGGGSNGGPVGPPCSLPTILCSTYCALHLDQLACLQQYPLHVYFNVYVLHFSDLVWIELSCYNSTNVWLLQLITLQCVLQLVALPCWDGPFSNFDCTSVALPNCRLSFLDCISVTWLMNCSQYIQSEQLVCCSWKLHYLCSSLQCAL